MQTEKRVNTIYRISGIICLLGIILYHGRNIYLEYVSGQVSTITIMSGISEIIVYLLFSTVACHAFICVGTQDRNILTNIIFWIILGVSVALITIAVPIGGNIFLRHITTVRNQNSIEIVRIIGKLTYVPAMSGYFLYPYIRALMILVFGLVFPENEKER